MRIYNPLYPKEMVSLPGDSLSFLALDTTACNLGAQTPNTGISVGPTGSGMTIEWDALDDVPITAKWALLKIHMHCTLSTVGTEVDGIWYVNWSPVGSTPDSTPGLNTLAQVAAQCDTIKNLCGSSINLGIIPLTTAKTFKLLHFGSTFNTRDIKLYLIGYGAKSHRV